MAKPRKAHNNKFNRADFNSVCAAVRTYWMLNRTIPELDQLDGICDVERKKIAAVLVHEDFMEAMDATGIPVRSKKGLNILQHHALVIMTDPNDRRPFAVRLKETGISSATWKAWLRNPIFASFLEQFYENALGDHMNAAHLSLMNQVDKGNTRALELYYAMTGRWSPNSQQERDLTAVISGLLEILQRKLDPNLLAEIAEEVSVLTGRKKEITPSYISEQVVDAEELPVAEFEEDRKNKYLAESWEIHQDTRSKEAFLESGGAAPKNVLKFDTSFMENE